MLCCLVLTFAVPAGAQTGDSAFTAMEALGSHRFEDLPDGGRIELLQSSTDSAGVRKIRAHLAEIARAFAAGDFRWPGVVHAGKQVPGTATMRERRDLISYRVEPLTGGGRLRITTRDAPALRAVHQYLSFQRGEHRHQH